MNDTGRIITSKMVYFDESSKQTLSRAERAFDERYDIESYRESFDDAPPLTPEPADANLEPRNSTSLSGSNP